MILSELNYLEVVHSENQIVGGIKDQYIKDERKFYEKVDIYKKLSGKADVKGKVAFSEADAYAWGKDALTNALTQAYTWYYGSESTSTSAAASS